MICVNDLFEIVSRFEIYAQNFRNFVIRFSSVIRIIARWYPRMENRSWESVSVEGQKPYTLYSV